MKYFIRYLFACALIFGVPMVNAAYVDQFRIDGNFSDLGTTKPLNIGSKATPNFQLDVSNGQIGISRSNGGGVATNLTNATAAGSCVYASGDDTVAIAQADDAATMPCMGISLAANKVLLEGFYTNAGWAFTAGDLIYVSADTAGGFTSTPPDTSGHQVQAVGIAITATTIYFSPSLVVFELGSDTAPELGGHLDLKGYTIFDSTTPGKIEFGYNDGDGRLDPDADSFITNFVLNIDSTDADGVFTIDSNGDTAAGEVFQIYADGTFRDAEMVSAAASGIALSENGDTALSGFTATSLIGALNELKATSSTYTTRTAYANLTRGAAGEIAYVDGPIIAITTAGQDVELPACNEGNTGKLFTIKDESGGAGQGDPTVVTSAGGNIDDKAAAVGYEIDQDYNSIDVYCSGSQWFVR